MKLLKKIDLKGCGTGRQLRFGHLLGNGEYQMVMAQCQKRVNRDAYGTISCLTAFDLDGNILWQHGEPTIITTLALYQLTCLCRYMILMVMVLTRL